MKRNGVLWYVSIIFTLNIEKIGPIYKLFSIVLDISKTPKTELFKLIQEIIKVITSSSSLRICFSRYHAQGSRESGQELSVMRQNETNKHSTKRCGKYARYIIFLFITCSFSKCIWGCHAASLNLTLKILPVCRTNFFFFY